MITEGSQSVGQGHVQWLPGRPVVMQLGQGRARLSAKGWRSGSGLVKGTSVTQTWDGQAGPWGWGQDRTEGFRKVFWFFCCFFFSFVFFTPKLLVIESYLNIFSNLYFFSVEPKDLVSTSWSNITNIFSHRERHASPQGEKLWRTKPQKHPKWYSSFSSPVGKSMVREVDDSN